MKNANRTLTILFKGCEKVSKGVFYTDRFFLFCDFFSSHPRNFPNEPNRVLYLFVLVVIFLAAGKSRSRYQSKRNHFNARKATATGHKTKCKNLRFYCNVLAYRYHGLLDLIITVRSVCREENRHKLPFAKKN